MLASAVRRHQFRFWQRKDVTHDTYVGAADGSMHLLAIAFVRRLSADVRQDLASYLGSGLTTHYSTVCSGTDAPVLCIDQFSQALLSELKVQSLFKHSFACEKKRSKREFLLRMFPHLPLLFRDLSELKDGWAVDAKSKTKQRVPSSAGTIGGFPCTDVARLNASASSAGNKQCILEATMRTGGVFRMILDYVKSDRRSFQWLVLENVVTLDTAGPNGQSNLDHCCSMLQDLGFAVMVFELNSTDFGRAHSRSRLYITCLCQNMLDAAGVSSDVIFDCMQCVMNSLVGHEPVALDKVLLTEGDPRIVNHYRRLSDQPAADDASSSAPPPKRSKDSSWAIKHSLLFEQLGLDWTRPSLFRDPRLQEVFPGTLELIDRQIDLLDKLHMQLPEQEPRIADLTMSLGWSKTTIGRAGCFSSHCKPWLGHRARFALPVEAFRMLGIYFDNEELLDEFHPSTLRDLAGNAFDSSSFLAVWVALQAGLSRLNTLRTPQHNGEQGGP